MEQINYNNTVKLLQEGKESSNSFLEAIIFYKSAINENEKNYSAYYNLGTLYEKLNDTEKAKDVYLNGINIARTFNDKKAETDLSFTLLGLMELTL